MIAGEPAPDVTLERPDGTRLSLAALRGAPLVLFFYPKDDTSGCTAEALDFSARKDAFDAGGVALLGVSKGTSKGKAKFAAKHGLSVPLATDVDGSACDAFGVWGEKTLYGRSYMGIERATFLIDAGGRVAQAWRKVKVPGHAEAVLAAAVALAGRSGPRAG